MAQEHFHRFRCARHVRAFCDADTAILDQLFRVAAADLVLRGAGQGHVALDAPRALAGDVLATELGRVFLDAAASDILEVFDVGEFLAVETVRVVDESVGVGHGDHFRAAQERLFGGELRHVAGTRNDNGLVGDAGTVLVEHFLGEIQQAIAGRFGPDAAAAPVQSLAG